MNINLGIYSCIGSIFHLYFKVLRSCQCVYHPCTIYVPSNNGVIQSLFSTIESILYDVERNIRVFFRYKFTRYNPHSSAHFYPESIYIAQLMQNIVSFFFKLLAKTTLYDDILTEQVSFYCEQIENLYMTFHSLHVAWLSESKLHIQPPPFTTIPPSINLITRRLKLYIGQDYKFTLPQGVQQCIQQHSQY